MLRFSFADSRAFPFRFRGMRIRPNRQHVVALVLLLNTIIVFRPFLFTGATLLSTTDSLFAHYPNILVGWRAIWAGGLPLWNPYEFAGMDFTTSMHDHMLNPWYWPLLLLPESAVLPGLTALFAACHLATGGFAYKIGRAFRLDWRTALLFAVSVQISGYWWFTTVTMISIFMGTGAIAAIYLLITRHQRAARATFVGLYLAGSAITFGGHIAYIVAFGLPLVITVVLYTFADVRARSPMKPLVIAVLALALALATGGFRIYSVLDFLANASGFSAEDTLGFHKYPADRAYFLLTSFIPNTFGFTLWESQEFLSILSVAGHHFHFAFYYGMPAAFLLTGAVCGHFRTRARVFALLAISCWMARPIAGFQPLTDLWSLTLIPLGHEMSFRVLSVYFSFGGILFALAAIERSPRLAQRTVVPFLIVATVVVALLISFYIKNAYFAQAATLGLTILARVAIGLLFVLMTFIAFRLTRTRRNGDTKAWWMLAGATAAGWLAFLGVAALQHTPETTTFFVSIDAATVLVVALLAILLPFFLRDDPAARWMGLGQTWPLRIAVVTAACLVGLVCFFPMGMEIPTRSPFQIAISGLTNGLRMLVLAVATVWLVTWWTRARRPAGTAGLMTALIVLTFIDLHGFLRAYEYAGGPPFHADIFPKAKLADAVLLAERQQTAGEADIWRMIDSDPALAATPVPPPWQKGGMASTVDYVASTANAGGALRLANEADDYATLFYDLPASDQDRWVAIGAWILAESDVKAGMFINNSLVRTAPRIDSTGTGRWIWTTTRILAPAGSTTRFHVFVQGRGSILIQSLRLVLGWTAPPVEEAERPRTAYVDRDALPTAKDLRNYRVNFPYRATGHWSGDAVSSIASVYGLMEYGGSDSALSARLLRFMERFESFTPTAGEKGLASTLTNGRLLDLFAVGFDTVGPLDFIRRPNALTRFALFDRFEVVADDDSALDRLASDTFDPTRSVILANSPGWATPSAAEAKRFEPLVYDGGRFDRLDFDLDNARPRILLFDDSYSPHWRATWNGKPIPILRANFNFMALGIPAGQGHLVLKFRPQPFLTLAYLSWITFLIIFGSGLVLLARQGFKNPTAALQAGGWASTRRLTGSSGSD